jgi:hypothetical protein
MNEPASFVVALLRPSNADESDYTVYWVFNPLRELGNFERRQVEWTWQPSKGSYLGHHSWEVTETPHSNPANSYKVVIPIGDDWLSLQVQGIKEGLNRMLK